MNSFIFLFPIIAIHDTGRTWLERKDQLISQTQTLRVLIWFLSKWDGSVSEEMTSNHPVLLLRRSR